MHNFQKFTSLFLIGFLLTYSSDGHVNLKTPAGGESLMPGEIVTISWEEEQTYVSVGFDLQFSCNGDA